MRFRLMVGIGCLLVGATAFAYPSTERKPSTQSQPPLDLGLQTAVGYLISDDNASLYITFGDALKIVDLGTFALAAAQPFALSSDSSVSGALKGIGYIPSLKKIYATQEGGNLVTFDLAGITTKPTRAQVAASKDLSLVATDVDNSTLYLYNVTDGQVIRYPVATGQASTIDVKSVVGGSFTVNAMVFVRNVSGSIGTLYGSTSVGRLFAIRANANTATAVTIDSGGTHNLKGIAALPNSSAIYVVDSTDTTVRKIDTASNVATATISLAPNSSVNQIAVSDVTNPSGTYGFVAGSVGLSIFDTANSSVFDLGTTSADHEPLPLSGTGPLLASGDGYLYISFGKIAVVSDNPWVTVSSATYNSGKSTLGTGGNVAISFQADETGTYTLRAGGTVAGTGTLLKDSTGATSGSIAAVNADKSVTIPYDGNASAFVEGKNTLFVFVTDSTGNVGRRATTVTVDTPPPAPAIVSTSFGTNKIFVNLQRLDVADLATYRVYVDTDQNAVKTKSIVAGTVSQPAAGSDPTVEVTGLTEGTLYYIAADTVDTNNNGSTTRTTTFASGAVATGMPEITVGPAGAAGETGCSLVVMPSQWDDAVRHHIWSTILYVIGGLLMFGTIWPWRQRHRYFGMGCVLFFIYSTLICWPLALHAQAPAPTAPPPHWTYELKGGFWLPTGSVVKRFLGICCNLTGMMEGGYLLHSRYGFDVGVGAFYDKGHAQGVSSGTVSQTTFTLLLLPITTDFTFRGHFRPNQLVVPFVRAGADAVYFRENDDGVVIKGTKWGLHGGGGAAFSLRRMTGVEPDFELNVRDVYLTVEGKYNWINSFGRRGLNLSGALLTIGVLFEF